MRTRQSRRSKDRTEAVSTPPPAPRRSETRARSDGSFLCRLRGRCLIQSPFEVIRVRSNGTLDVAFGELLHEVLTPTVGQGFDLDGAAHRVEVFAVARVQ